MIGIGLATLLVGFATSWAITPAVIKFGHRLNAVDAPGPRKVHLAAVPRIGGVAVFAGFAAALAFGAVATGYWEKFPEGFSYWGYLAAGASAMLVLGLADDLRGVPVRWKFAVQTATGITAWIAGFRIESLTLPFVESALDLGWLALPLTVIWIVGITNALNLIDGLDGLAAGSAMITCAAVAVMAFLAGKVAVTAISVALLGSLLGFLRFNFNPARIFLGDSGSMFLGFVLAVTSIYGSQKNTTAVAVLVPVLVLGLPIFDTTFAVLRRTRKLTWRRAQGRESWGAAVRGVGVLFSPDRGHVHHRLLDAGFSHRAAVLLLYVATLTLAGIALLDTLFSGMTFGLITAILVSTVFLLAALLLSRLRSARTRASARSAPLPLVAHDKGVGSSAR